MPLQATSGAASYDAFGGGVPAVPNYIEECFATYLYTGNGSTQIITNGVDLAGKGGLVWVKERPAPSNHYLVDTVRGVGNNLKSNTTDAQQAIGLNSFTSTGFTTGSFLNDTGSPYVSWTFREQPKFFDCVTYTGDGTSGQQISHSLGSAPGCVIVKPTSTTGNWGVWHRGNGTTDYTGLSLNQTTASQNPGAGFYTGFTSTYFTPRLVEDASFNVGNLNGVTYVAYLFAHNAGGFGLTGTDNVISCGTYTGTGTAGNAQTLGYEPQWLLIKRTNTATDWLLFDNMRGLPVTASDAQLIPNNSSAETTQDKVNPTATGFALTTDPDVNANGSTYIYIAIRRGPMKVPTDGTSVFSPSVSTAAVGTDITTGFPVDMQFPIGLSTITLSNAVDRLRGVSSTTTSSGLYLEQATTNAETSGTVTRNWGNTGFQFPQYFSTLRTLFLNFRRAPSVFDVVCYTGTGGASQTFTHNLGVAPELVIVKCRNDATAWESLGTTLSSSQRQIYLNRTAAGVSVASGHLGWNGTDGAYKAPTSSVVYFGGDSDVGGSGLNYVAYLFATCPGVSKVGSYTGTGTTQTINCGFTAGARFVMIKRTDSTGDWYVWDSARGIVSGNDPYLLMNSTAAEVTSTDYIDPVSTGFEISSTAPAAINASGGTFIFLAIA